MSTGANIAAAALTPSRCRRMLSSDIRLGGQAVFGRESFLVRAGNGAPRLPPSLYNLRKLLYSAASTSPGSAVLVAQPASLTRLARQAAMERPALRFLAASVAPGTWGFMHRRRYT